MSWAALGVKLQTRRFVSLLRVWERIFLNPSRALGRQGRRKDSVSLLRGDGARQQTGSPGACARAGTPKRIRSKHWALPGTAKALPAGPGKELMQRPHTGEPASPSVSSAEEPPRSPNLFERL